MVMTKAMFFHWNESEIAKDGEDGQCFVSSSAFNNPFIIEKPLDTVIIIYGHTYSS